MKRMIIILSAFFLVIIVAAGAYTAVRLLASPDEETAVAGSGRVMESISVANGGEPVSVRTTILPAPELPDEESAAFGVFVSRQDNSIIIGTGNIDLEVDVEVDGATGQRSTTLTPRTDGPEREIVISPDTIIYKDVTDLSVDQPTESGEREIVQAIRQVESADEIGENTEIEVWGEQRGDRIFADVLVFGPLAGGAFE
jgi:hypothetical protein